MPPQKPTIFDDRGKEIPSVAGPYEEDSEMKLTCMVSGGRFLNLYLVQVYLNVIHFC